tara:strand:- start:24 stop:371 length:348 start_codon:yes stop_codon:yes gene_type:complete
MKCVHCAVEIKVGDFSCQKCIEEKYPDVLQGIKRYPNLTQGNVVVRVAIEKELDSIFKMLNGITLLDCPPKNFYTALAEYFRTLGKVVDENSKEEKKDKSFKLEDFLTGKKEQSH